MSNRCLVVHRMLPQTQPLVLAAGCSTAQLLVRSVRAAQGSSSYPSSSWVKKKTQHHCCKESRLPPLQAQHSKKAYRGATQLQQAF